MIDKFAVTIFTMIICLFMAMQVLVFGLSLLRQQQLDGICHKYALRMDKEGGLDQDAVAQMSQELEDAGFTVLSISATQQGVFGELMWLQVEAAWPAYRLLPELRPEEVDLLFAYNTEVFCRILVN